jgi:hypothetical protein
VIDRRLSACSTSRIVAGDTFVTQGDPERRDPDRLVWTLDEIGVIGPILHQICRSLRSAQSSSFRATRLSCGMGSTGRSRPVGSAM